MSAAMQIVGRLRENTVISTSGGILAVIALIAIVVPWLSPNDYLQTDFDNILSSPGAAGMHWFGTDDLGRDQLVLESAVGQTFVEPAESSLEGVGVEGQHRLVGLAAIQLLVVSTVLAASAGASPQSHVVGWGGQVFDSSLHEETFIEIAA